MVRFRVAAYFGDYDEYFAVDNGQIAYGYPSADYPALIGADSLHAEGHHGQWDNGGGGGYRLLVNPALGEKGPTAQIACGGYTTAIGNQLGSGSDPEVVTGTPRDGLKS